MDNLQTGILATATQLGRYLSFSIADPAKLTGCLQALAEVVDGESVVAGLGQSLLQALGKEVNGLRTLQARSCAGFEIPSTPAALWLWLRGSDRGELFHRSRELEALLQPAFLLYDTLDSFRYRDGLDLSGYEDGTENPQDEEAIAAAFVQGQGEGLDGSSFVAAQQWLHDLEGFNALTENQQDNTIGRRKSDNQELEDAPLSAHVKRTAQEDFEPEAFVLRRSMPWADDMNAGLYFVAFGKSLDAFEAQLQRMSGAEDGISDALFTFTRPISGAYFWCPPMRDGGLDLRILGL